jgi:DNA-binding Lrp family transcriptional regulator
MLLIVRLFPKTDLNRIWNFVENELVNYKSDDITPLYATMSEGMMNVGLIFDVKESDSLCEFITEEIVKCDEVHHTKTISLMKPIFFPIPKKKPEIIHRYLIRIYAHPKYYKKIYDYLANYNYPFNLFPIYISYSMGDEDIIMNIAADSGETVNKFLKEHIRNLDGVDQSSFYPVFKSKRFAPLKDLIEKQKQLLAERAKKKPEGEVDLYFDWIENFEQYAKLTGAFPGDY